MKRNAFTLVEILSVVAIIALLLAILLPILASSRAKARETNCLSNLHQIGLATFAYAQDYDDRFPLGGDAIDINKPGEWTGTDVYGKAILLKPLPEILNPYTKNSTIWHCPADTGYERCGVNEDDYFDTRPSAFDKYGNSYLYNTDYVLHDEVFSGLQGLSKQPPFEERNASQLVVFYDGIGKWHGGGFNSPPRFCAAFVDGHVKAVSQSDMQSALAVQFVGRPPAPHPSPPP